MFEYPSQHLIAGDYLLDKPRMNIILQMLNYFSQKNMRIKVVNLFVKTTHKAKWYDTHYSVVPIESNRLKYFLNGN